MCCSVNRHAPRLPAHVLARCRHDISKQGRISLATTGGAAAMPLGSYPCTPLRDHHPMDYTGCQTPYSSSNRRPATQSTSPAAVRFCPPLTEENSPLAVLPQGGQISAPPAHRRGLAAGPVAASPAHRREATVGYVEVPPAHRGVLAAGRVASPPLTEDESPLAVLYRPPLTERLIPLAVLRSPPLTTATLWRHYCPAPR